MDIIELGQSFRAARIARRLTQQDAARHAGISVATISRFERGDLLELGVVKLISLFRLVDLDLTPRPRGHSRTLDDIQQENAAVKSAQALATNSRSRDLEGKDSSPTVTRQRVRKTKAEAAPFPTGNSRKTLLLLR